MSQSSNVHVSRRLLSPLYLVYCSIYFSIYFSISLFLNLSNQ